MIINKIQGSCTSLSQINRLETLLEISSTDHIFLKTFNSEFQDIEVWLSDQNRQPLEIVGRINLTLVIK